MKRILLVEPQFPIPAKSRYHRNFLPIGLLKLASYFRDKGHDVRLVRGKANTDFEPDDIMITSLFTYWSSSVWDCVKYYKKQFPGAKTIVGGIYASLMPGHCKKSGCDEVFVGIHEEAEKYPPAYDLVDVDYQIIHTSRGCIRRCRFCGVYKIEPEFVYKRSIATEIASSKLVFYDNNLLANPYVKDILTEIATMKYRGRVIQCDSQCGFDGRLLTTELAGLIKKARFKYPKIAWDGPFSDHKSVKKQHDMLIKAGYRAQDISIFMIYNYEHDFFEMEKKRVKCWHWKVQISDCRYRPVNQTFDNYSPKHRQTNEDYYIHKKWTDAEVKQFRRNVRRQNICIRHRKNFYSESLAQKKNRLIVRSPFDLWRPGEITPPERDILHPNCEYFIVHDKK